MPWNLDLRLTRALCLSFLCACAPSGHDASLGELTLALTSEAGALRYRLADARLSLEGPASQELTAHGEAEIALSLPAGSYRLTLHEGYRLVRDDEGDAGSATVSARLLSQNPAPVVIRAGEITHWTLRFGLDDATGPGLDGGRLAVGIDVGSGDAGAAAEACPPVLRIDEIDYEQASSDGAELVEIVNAGSCAAALGDVVLELVNGSDGRVYGRTMLAEAGAALAPGERLVVADAEVLSRLPATVKRVMLGGSGLQNGPDGVRIVQGKRVLDAVAYEGPVAGCGEGTPAPADDETTALARCPEGFDTDDNARDFRPVAPTPGAPSPCVL